MPATDPTAVVPLAASDASSPTVPAANTNASTRTGAGFAPILPPAAPISPAPTSSWATWGAYPAVAAPSAHIAPPRVAPTHLAPPHLAPPHLAPPHLPPLQPASARPASPFDATDRPGPARSLGVASLVLGGFAALGAALPVVNLASAAFAATGAGLGIAALFQLSRSRGVALAGAIVSVVALTASVALATVYTGVASTAANGLFGGVASIPAIVDEYEDETIGTTDPNGPTGTVGDPIPLGETIVVTRNGETRWEITLTEATYDAEEEVLRGNGASDVIQDLTGDPAQYAYVSAEITYLGEDVANLYEEVYVCFSTVDETFYCTGEVMAIAPGTDLAMTDEIDSGETVEGNFLVAIPAAAEDDGHWVVAGEWTDFLHVTTS
ncbi:hypothetical protein [Labedella endophytica]|uniref:DUF4190 domain-containing protein n=1 Tax=Labedella endophytica TaxID=1523160 RepID=A0A3S0VIE3_9MICO|nr:hypothetical protein [Labedella endophytica]RUR03241.1 hypothetical protein ELQ94_01420 [Labedella endophytica]